MEKRTGIFAGEHPFEIARRWLVEAEPLEVNDPNAMALATVDAGGMPNVRMVLLKEITDDVFVFYTNYQSVKGTEIAASGKAALVLHWKSLRRQIRVRGTVEKVDTGRSDAYFASRSLKSRIGAIASDQSKPLESRAALIAKAAKVAANQGLNPARPAHWGGFEICPTELEFWADGDHRLHNRFRWTRGGGEMPWKVERLHP